MRKLVIEHSIESNYQSLVLADAEDGRDILPIFKVNINGDEWSHENSLPAMGVVGRGFKFIFDGRDYSFGGYEPLECSLDGAFVEVYGDVSEPIYYIDNGRWDCTDLNKETLRILHFANRMIFTDTADKIVGDRAVSSIRILRGHLSSANYIAEEIFNNHFNKQS